MRPVGVTLSAYFQFVRAVLLAVWGIGIMFVSGLASRFVSLAAEGSAAQRFLAGFGHFLFVAFLLYALITAILGVGLLLLQNWARLLTIVLSALGVLTLLPRLIHHHPISSLFALLNLAVLIYLLLPQTRAHFNRKPTTETRPA